MMRATGVRGRCVDDSVKWRFRTKAADPKYIVGIEAKGEEKDTTRTKYYYFFFLVNTELGLSGSACFYPIPHII